MGTETIAVLMPGDMGHAVGRVLGEHGYRVITCLNGRGKHTRALAASAGLENVASLDAVVAEAGLILSILPPAAALAQARDVAAAMNRSGHTPAYVDCNAIAPQTATQVADVFSATGATFIDAGIIGLAPGKGTPPRFYVSAPNVETMTALNGKGIEVIPCGSETGQASALKMVYAGLTKGTWTLHTAVLLAAKQMGVLPRLLEEFDHSQKPAVTAMRQRVPRLPADSERWIGEMEEIASSFRHAGVPSGFHEAAADIFRILARTPFATETRQTMDTGRTLEDALSVYAAHLAPANDNGKVD